MTTIQDLLKRNLTKEEAYEYYHALIDTYVEDSIKAAYAFREAHTINS